MPYRFEWDSSKAAANANKHGVSFHDAVTVFGDQLARCMEDPATAMASSGLCCLDKPRLASCWWLPTANARH